MTTPSASALQRRIGQRVAGQFDRALGAVEAGAGLVGRGALAWSKVASVDQPLPRSSTTRCSSALGLRQHAGGGADLGLGLLGLQLQIGLVERRQRLAGLDGLADLDQPLRHLAGDPEAHVGLDPRPDRADEAALGRERRVADRRDEDGAVGLRLRLRLSARLVAGGKGEEGEGNQDGGDGGGRGHGRGSGRELPGLSHSAVMNVNNRQ